MYLFLQNNSYHHRPIWFSLYYNILIVLLIYKNIITLKRKKNSYWDLLNRHSGTSADFPVNQMNCDTQLKWLVFINSESIRNNIISYIQAARVYRTNNITLYLGFWKMWTFRVAHQSKVAVPTGAVVRRIRIWPEVQTYANRFRFHG